VFGHASVENNMSVSLTRQTHRR